MKTVSQSQPRKLKQSAADLLRSLPGYDPFENSDGYTFDPKRAESALRFFERELQHVKGEKAGKLFALEPWQQAIIANLFGWVDDAGLRRYREALVYIPRKNGKTFLASGIGNYLLFEDREPGAEIYCAAADREQAALLFDVAKQQVLRNPKLAARGKPFKRVIAIESDASFFKVISSDADTKHGQNSHGVLIDELHAQPDRELVDVLTTSTGSRRQPLTCYFTTADYARESICNEKLDYARKVRDGIVVNPTFLPVIFELLPEQDWEDEANWSRANPNLGVSVSLAYLRNEFRKAKDQPTYENTFRRLHLNQQTQQDERWIPMQLWDGCNAKVDPKELEGAECFAGLDLASKSDIAALVLLFRRGDGYVALPWFFAPEEHALEREKRDRAPYVTWGRQGFLELTPTKWTDYDRIRSKIQEIGKLFRIRKIAFDRFDACQLVQQLAGDGFDMVEFGQGMVSMSMPTKELERLLTERKLSHGGHPVLRWMADNVSIARDAADNWKPDRRKSSEKIDGIVALIMAIGVCLQAKGTGPTVYAKRGLLTL